MLRKRLVAGTLLAAAVGVGLWLDGSAAPYYPALFAAAVLAAVLCTRELLGLIAHPHRPNRALTTAGGVAVLAANWVQPVFLPAADPWHPVLLAFAGFVLAAFLVEMATYTGPTGGVGRIAHAVLAVAYLGLLPSAFLRLRWLDPHDSGWLLALVVFVPKCGDIGAYTAGRIVGRTPFARRLSPKKTWEGFAGGLALSAGTAVGIDAYHPLFRGGWPEAVGFGLTVGTAAVLGDLAESLIKRESGQKDAASSVPGFGGVLDILDSVLFAAPVAYVWVAGNWGIRE